MSEKNAIRARVALTGQFASLDDDVTGYENLIVLGRLRGLSRAAAITLVFAPLTLRLYTEQG